jgi:hypothetical protein
MEREREGWGGFKPYMCQAVCEADSISASTLASNLQKFQQSAFLMANRGEYSGLMYCSIFVVPGVCIFRSPGTHLQWLY